MMRISRASLYAIHGLAYLAGQSRDRFVPISEILMHVQLPEKHLAKIFLGLVKGGLLRSIRGVSGGFALAQRARDIKALDIVRLVDGPADDPGCLMHPTRELDGSCCGIGRLLSDGRRKVTRTLSSCSLVDLAGISSRQRRRH